ncbi:methyltransferase domain-containing protein [Streptomyces sp. H27-H5]|uniref:methyltransferase domain-containing protein n=1 Tax=Streptomyces sp. H27-H5 TaxID=2996460 RepID=UPI00226E9FF6|nr:methyltransferase domain-containing protein [Streptomyces sp. H27-H5]MCY0960083.1 methyltransferase domain-containing protein [Streptomyces sp. H27-H5]
MYRPRERLTPPEGVRSPRALDVACGTGEVGRLLDTLGYRVDAVDFAAAAVDHAAASPPTVSFHRLDITAGYLAPLAPAGGYALITLRRALALLPDRTRVLAQLAALLAPGGRLCVITPHAEHHPQTLRTICLDGSEIAMVSTGWHHIERLDTDGTTTLLLTGAPTTDVIHREKGRPDPAATAGVAVVLTNPRGEVLLGWNQDRARGPSPSGSATDCWSPPLSTRAPPPPCGAPGDGRTPRSRSGTPATGSAGRTPLPPRSTASTAP